jgi:hypothetical protein
LVTFDILAGGFLFIIILMLALLKLFSFSGNKKMNIATKLLITFTYLIIGAIGAAIIVLTDGDVWGHVLCGTSVYLLAILYLGKW